MPEEINSQIVVESGAALIDDVLTAASASQGRYMLGLVGYPGAGKSTAAAYLADGINARAADKPAVVVPMDGFHRYNAQLLSMHLLALKGVPDSFDAQAFVDLLTLIRSTDNAIIGCPAFDRAIEEPCENAIFVEAHHKIIIVEGNYLLLDQAPWDQIRPLLNSAWFIDCDIHTIEPRLMERHIKGGRNPEDARIKMENTDLPNARLIEKTKNKADRLIKLPQLKEK